MRDDIEFERRGTMVFLLREGPGKSLYIVDTFSQDDADYAVEILNKIVDGKI